MQQLEVSAKRINRKRIGFKCGVGPDDGETVFGQIFKKDKNVMRYVVQILQDGPDVMLSQLSETRCTLAASGEQIGIARIINGHKS